jgi:phage gp36-like protein
MMPYISMADITGMIPRKFLIEGLDDDGDGEAEAATINQVLEQASGMVDALLEGRYATPFSNPLPKVVCEAAKVFACELIYQRRGTPADQNPWTKQASQYRDPVSGMLTKIAAGTMPLYPTIQRADASAVAITGASKAASKTGLST